MRPRGRSIIERVNAVLLEFNPLTITVDYFVCDGNQVVTYWSVTNRHVGTFAWIAAIDLWVKIKGSSFAVFQDGRIMHARDHWDVQDLIDQLVTSEDS